VCVCDHHRLLDNAAHIELEELETIAIEPCTVGLCDDIKVARTVAIVGCCIWHSAYITLDLLMPLYIYIYIYTSPTPISTSFSLLPLPLLILVLLLLQPWWCADRRRAIQLRR